MICYNEGTKCKIYLKYTLQFLCQNGLASTLNFSERIYFTSFAAFVSASLSSKYFFKIIKNLIEEAQCQNHYISTRYTSAVNCGRSTNSKKYTDKLILQYLGFLIKQSVLEPTDIVPSH